MEEVGVTGIPIHFEILIYLFLLLLSSAYVIHSNNKYTSNTSGLPVVVVTSKQKQILTSLSLSQTNNLPLAVFVNTKSGGQTGDLLLYRLRTLLHPRQVFDIIQDEGPYKGLHKMLTYSEGFRVLVCGGDGTVSWVIECIEKHTAFNKACAGIAIFPMGTGNDLARVFGWTKYDYSGIVDFLCEVHKAKAMKLDRWDIKISDIAVEYSKKLPKNRNGSSLHEISDSSVSNEKGKVMSCYLGIGVDAQIALNFHLKRESQPHLFRHRLINKFWYASSGGKEILMQRFSDFSEKVSLVCDGDKVKIPIGIEGLVVMNIRSYAAGVDLWGDIEHDSYSASLMEQNKTHKSSPSFKPLWDRSVVEESDENESIEDIDWASEPDISWSQEEARFTESSANKHVKSRRKSSVLRQRPGAREGQMESNKLHLNFTESYFDDGFVEVLGVQSSFQLGAAQVGLGRPVKICQGQHLLICISDLESCPVQIDGEPFLLKPERDTINSLPFNLESARRSFSHYVNSIELGKNKIDKIIEVKRKGQVEILSRYKLDRRYFPKVPPTIDKEDLNIFKDVMRWAEVEEVVSSKQKKQIEKEYLRRLKVK